MEVYHERHLLVGPDSAALELLGSFWWAEGHPENAERLATALRAVNTVACDNWSAPAEPIPSPSSLASSAELRQDLLRAHSDELVSSIYRMLNGETVTRDDPFLEPVSNLASTSPDLEWDEAARRISGATLTAAATVIQLADAVVAGVSDRALALVRPAGHHTGVRKTGSFCGINSVMVAALRLASSGQKVGILDVDVHFAGGHQQIALERNNDSAGHVFISVCADVFAALMDRKLAKQAQEAGHWMRPFLADDLDDEAMLQATKDGLHAMKGVDVILVSLGLDAGAGEKEGAKVTPMGFENVVRAVVEEGVPCVFALEGGYELESGVFESNCEGVVRGLL